MVMWKNLLVLVFMLFLLVRGLLVLLFLVLCIVWVMCWCCVNLCYNR